jgi:hypothetical protein
MLQPLASYRAIHKRNCVGRSFRTRRVATTQPRPETTRSVQERSVYTHGHLLLPLLELPAIHDIAMPEGDALMLKQIAWLFDRLRVRLEVLRRANDRRSQVR